MPTNRSRLIFLTVCGNSETVLIGAIRIYAGIGSETAQASVDGASKHGIEALKWYTIKTVPDFAAFGNYICEKSDCKHWSGGSLRAIHIPKERLDLARESSCFS